MRLRLVWQTASLLIACGFAFAPEVAAQKVAITFDDLPVHGSLPAGVTRAQVATDILAALKSSGTPPVYGFVNAVWLERNPSNGDVLALWRKAGYPLGNHTWSHMNLNEHATAKWEADLLKNEPALEQRMHDKDWRWIRFPFLAEGAAATKTDEVRVFLSAHHYRIAGVTLSFGDYLFNEPYARCTARHDAAAVARLEGLFLDAARDDLVERRAMAKAALGHEIPLVLLMHVGAFDAHMLPALLTMYHGEGVQFVSLEEAERDPFYANDVDPRRAIFPDTLEAAVAAKQVTVARRPAPTAELDNICK